MVHHLLLLMELGQLQVEQSLPLLFQPVEAALDMLLMTLLLLMAMAIILRILKLLPQEV